MRCPRPHRRGLTNEEIAQRLGISLDGAKYHVSQILSKLAVANREEAAALDLVERRPWWARWSLWARIAGAATTAAALGGLALLAWGVLRTGAPTEARRPQLTTVSADAIPWSDTPAANVAEPFTIPGVPACQADDLHVEANSPYVGGGPKDTSSWVVLVMNEGTVPCFVGSTLDIGFTTPNGKLAIPAERTGGDIVYLAPPRGYLQQLATPAPGFSDRAGGEIGIHSCHVPDVTQMEISPGPGLGVVAMDPGPAGGWGTPCPNSAQSYLAHLSPEDCCSGDGISTQTSIDAPASARLGERLRFMITVTNWRGVSRGLPPPEGYVEPTPPPLEWSPCPTYHQELEGVPGTFGTYRLNCEQVAPLPPYGIATFEMFIDVPADARPGPSVLTWGIDGSPTVYESVSINVWIEP